MKTLIVLAIIIIVAAITNPKKGEHVDIVKEKISQSAVESLDSGSNFERAGTAIGVTLGLKFLDSMIESVIAVDNYVLFSLTKFSYAGNEKIIGIGAFGNVWLFGDLKEGLADLKK